MSIPNTLNKDYNYYKKIQKFIFSLTLHFKEKNSYNFLEQINNDEKKLFNYIYTEFNQIETLIYLLGDDSFYRYFDNSDIKNTKYLHYLYSHQSIKLDKKMLDIIYYYHNFNLLCQD